ncbi:pituitary adenylate cyclase-activating polypeptide type i receptor [Limosa lapponica baueri]|uniref:Pituitary adenylate cyclase-activating polypeptide type i receptor n=1 Tax=Limosa lapponica baueri TaxID=1758121 RepID=A0A2I0U465_LIMLA|nr:pituitary adenylate cyclase-activating polypeptide type i receptor [Limosa lapponica baueri]
MAWMMGQSVPSASLLMTSNWEEWLIDRPGFCAAIQTDLDRLLMEFNKGKCKVLHLWRHNALHMLGAIQLESGFIEKDLES